MCERWAHIDDSNSTQELLANLRNRDSFECLNNRTLLKRPLDLLCRTSGRVLIQVRVYVDPIEHILKTSAPDTESYVCVFLVKELCTYRALHLP